MTVLSNFQVDVPSLSGDLALDSHKSFLFWLTHLEVDLVDWKYND